MSNMGTTTSIWQTENSLNSIKQNGDILFYQIALFTLRKRAIIYQIFSQIMCVCVSQIIFFITEVMGPVCLFAVVPSAKENDPWNRQLCRSLDRTVCPVIHIKKKEACLQSGSPQTDLSETSGGKKSFSSSWEICITKNVWRLCWGRRDFGGVHHVHSLAFFSRMRSKIEEWTQPWDVYHQCSSMDRTPSMRVSPL